MPRAGFFVRVFLYIFVFSSRVSPSCSTSDAASSIWFSASWPDRMFSSFLWSIWSIEVLWRELSLPSSVNSLWLVMLWFQTPVPECTVVNLPVQKLPVNVFDSRCFFCSYCSYCSWVPLLGPPPFPSFFLRVLPSVIWRRWSVWFSLLQAFVLFSVPLLLSASSWRYSSCERWGWLRFCSYFPESSQRSVFIFPFLFIWLVSCRSSSPSAWGGKSTAAKTTALLLFILLCFISLLLLYSTFVLFGELLVPSLSRIIPRKEKQRHSASAQETHFLDVKTWPNWPDFVLSHYILISLLKVMWTDRFFSFCLRWICLITQSHLWASVSQCRVHNTATWNSGDK